MGHAHARVRSLGIVTSEGVSALGPILHILLLHFCGYQQLRQVAGLSVVISHLALYRSRFARAALYMKAMFSFDEPLFEVPSPFQAAVGGHSLLLPLTVQQSLVDFLRSLVEAFCSCLLRRPSCRG